MKITKWVSFEISRAKIGFSHAYGIDKSSDLLTKILPFGTVLSQSIKFLRVDNNIYFTYLKMDGQVGKGLTLIFEPQTLPANVMGLLSKMRTLIDKLPPEAPLELESDMVQSKPLRIKSLDIALFAILAQLPTIVLGQEEEIMVLISAIVSMFPPELQTLLSFVSQSNSLSENVSLRGMPFTEEIFSELEDVKGQYTLIILGDRVYGQFTSRLCAKIATCAANGDFIQVRSLITDLYQIVTASEDLPPALELANQLGIHLSDAQLALIMRAKYLGKSVPYGLLEVRT